VTLDIPVYTPSVVNQRNHWHAKAKQTKAQRQAVAWCWSVFKRNGDVPPLPVVVWLTRVSPRELDDDNLRPALKAVRDEVAYRLGLPNDRDPSVKWEYAQRKGRPAVVIHVEPQ